MHAARIGKTFQAIGPFTRTPRCTFLKILALCFHTSSSLHNLNESAEIPMPIGRRPRPNPALPPPTLVVPPPVKYVERTTPRMQQADAEEFLYPLYLRGWRVELIRTKDKNIRIKTPFLTAKFTLKDNTSIHKAVCAIHQLEKQEKHDICYEVFRNPKPELSLRLQTHSARKWKLGRTNDTSSNVTLRDIRFAALFEKIIQENEYLLDQSLHERTSTNLLLFWDKVLLWFAYADADSTTVIPSKKRKTKPVKFIPASSTRKR